MKLTPENSSNAEATRETSARRELTPEERALLPDFEDKARRGKSVPTVSAPPDPQAAPDDRSAVLGGAFGGCVGNIVLGFILLSFERAGFSIYGPGALAIVLGFTLIFLLAREWPRRIVLRGVAFAISLLISYGILYLLIRPTFSSLNPGTLPGALPAQSGSDLQAPAQYPPPSAGANNS